MRGYLLYILFLENLNQQLNFKRRYSKLKLSKFYDT